MSPTSFYNLWKILLTFYAQKKFEDFSSLISKFVIDAIN